MKTIILLMLILLSTSVMAIDYARVERGATVIQGTDLNENPAGVQAIDGEVIRQTDTLAVKEQKSMMCVATEEPCYMEIHLADEYTISDIKLSFSSADTFNNVRIEVADRTSVFRPIASPANPQESVSIAVPNALQPVQKIRMYSTGRSGDKSFIIDEIYALGTDNQAPSPDDQPDNQPTIPESDPPSDTTLCEDSDGGINYQSRGQTKGQPSDSYSNNVADDYCTGTTLHEFSCNSNQQIELTDYTCPHGCSNGFCTPPPVNNECTDTDNGKDQFVKGTISGPHFGIAFSKDDHCNDNTDGWVVEHFCTTENPGSTLTWENIQCDKGCQDGACIRDPILTISSPTDNQEIPGYSEFQLIFTADQSLQGYGVIPWWEEDGRPQPPYPGAIPNTNGVYTLRLTSPMRVNRENLHLDIAQTNEILREYTIPINLGRFCYDSDPENNKFTKGSVTGMDGDQGVLTRIDECVLDNTAVSQKICSSVFINSIDLVECSNGCSDGACREQPDTSCQEENNCIWQNPICINKNSKDPTKGSGASHLRCICEDSVCTQISDPLHPPPQTSIRITFTQDDVHESSLIPTFTSQGFTISSEVAS